jgi:hypothetical protein
MMGPSRDPLTVPVTVDVPPHLALAISYRVGQRQGARGELTEAEVHDFAQEYVTFEPEYYLQGTDKPLVEWLREFGAEIDSEGEIDGDV